MKIYIFTFILLLSTIPVLGQKQLATDSLRNTYRKEFLVNPIPLFLGGFEVGYGKIDSKKRNLRFFVGYYFSEKPNYYNEDSTTNSVSVAHKNMEGFKLETQYLFMKPVKGGVCFYGGGYFILKSIQMDITRTYNGASVVTTTNYKARATSAGIGYIFGARQYISDSFFVDAYFGGGITVPLGGNNIDDVHLDTVNPFKRSINPKFGLTCGISL